MPIFEVNKANKQGDSSHDEVLVYIPSNKDLYLNRTRRSQKIMKDRVYSLYVLINNNRINYSSTSKTPECEKEMVILKYTRALYDLEFCDLRNLKLHTHDIAHSGNKRLAIQTLLKALDNVRTSDESSSEIIADCQELITTVVCELEKVDSYATFSDFLEQWYLRQLQKIGEELASDLNISLQERVNKYYKRRLSIIGEDVSKMLNFPRIREVEAELLESNMLFHFLPIKHKISIMKQIHDEMILDAYGFTPSEFSPESGIDSLLKSLRKEGALILSGHLGRPFYEGKPAKSKTQLGEHNLYYYKRESYRVCDPDIGHTILVIGAKKIVTPTKNLEYVYYLDPQDGDFENQKNRKVYMMSYERLASSIANIDNHPGASSPGPFAFCNAQGKLERFLLLNDKMAQKYNEAINQSRVGFGI